MRMTPLVLAGFFFLVVARARAGEVVVEMPDGVSARSALALAPTNKPAEDGPAVDGEVKGQAVAFSKLDPAVPYDLRITLADGTVLQGVNAAWYNEEPAKPNAAALSDDDREQVRALVSDIESFYNISRIIMLSGNHNRATALVERIRSTDFHSDSGGEVIWRVELWYFKNHFGGWQELTQTNKVLRRVRFKTHAEYHAVADKLRWVPALGGVSPDKGGGRKTIPLTAEDLTPPDPVPPKDGDATK